MITRENLPQLLDLLGFVRGSSVAGDVRTRHFKQKDGAQCDVSVDVEREKILFTDAGSTVNDDTSSNFSKDENFVVLECVCRLLDKGYRAEDIEIENGVPKGHGESGGWSDIVVKKKDEKDDAAGNFYAEGRESDDKSEVLIIECKTADEFDRFWRNTQMYVG